MVEEGQPEFIEQAIHTALRKAGCNTQVHGKGLFPRAGEYTSEVMRSAAVTFMREYDRKFVAPADPLETVAAYH